MKKSLLRGVVVVSALASAGFVACGGDDAPVAPVDGGVLDGGDGWMGVKGFFDWLQSKKYKVQVRVFLSRGGPADRDHQSNDRYRETC